MGKYSPGYYNVGFDPVVTNAEGQAVKMTTRGENGEYLEIVVKEKYNDLGERTVEAVGGIKTNMKNPADVEAAINALEGAIGLAPGYQYLASDIGKFVRGAAKIINDRNQRMKKAIDAIDDPDKAPPIRLDPLLLDLDGDGVETISAISSGVNFDLDSNGFSEATGWVKSDDALLVLDRDSNGSIDSGKELFGDHTTLRSGAKATTGFQALAEVDSNKDGVINAADMAFTDLKVWRDLNQDGVSQQNEIQSLNEVGITNINLSTAPVLVNSAEAIAATAAGNSLSRHANIVFSDGHTSHITETIFQRDTAYSIAIQSYVISDPIKSLPNIAGYGNLLDLHQALAREVAGGTDSALADALNTYLNSSDKIVRASKLDALLYAWADVRSILPNSRGSAMDARQIAFLEVISGQSIETPDSNAAIHLDMRWQQVRAFFDASLLEQTKLSNLFDKVSYRWNAEKKTFSADLSAVIGSLEESLDASPVHGKELLADFAGAINGLGVEDSFNYLALREYFLEKSPELAWVMDSAGLKVYDHLGQGLRWWSPHIEGTDSSEAVRGSLTQGDGYLNSLYGNDAIWGTVRNEVLINGSGDSLLYAAEGNDTIYAGAGDDTLDGGIGNDLLFGEAGNDTYIFRKGSGVDRVRGWNTGDKIWLASNADEVNFRRNNNDLLIGFNSTADILVVENWFNTNPFATSNTAPVITFRDGTTWLAAGIAEYLSQPVLPGSTADLIVGTSASETLDGQEGGDKIAGNAGDDVIIGGTGNDFLYGSATFDAYNFGFTATQSNNGNDVYIFRRGDGQDTIADFDVALGNQDVLRLIGISPDEVSGQIITSPWPNDSYADLRLDFGQGDSVLIKQALGKYSEAYGKIERIEFDNGVVWTGRDLLFPIIGTEGADAMSAFFESTALSGGGGNDRLNGGRGDDHLDGGADDDVLNGADGNDQLSGGDGKDALLGGYGDDVLSGGTGDDVLRGNAGNDVLRGGDGNDTLYGGLGNDDLDGDEGDDLLIGGEDAYSSRGNGNDTYHLRQNGGVDQIIDVDSTIGNIDKIVVEAGINPADVTLYRYGNSLEISASGHMAFIEIKNWFDPSGKWRVEEIHFADGTVWNEVAIADRSRVLGTEWSDYLTALNGVDDQIDGLDSDDQIFGASGNDTLSGGNGNDRISGGAGNDQIFGDDGNDTLSGGTGDDRLTGGRGDDKVYTDASWINPNTTPGHDVIFYSRFDGNDTIVANDGGSDEIVFAADVSPQEVTVRHVANSLVLRLDEYNSLTLVDWAIESEKRIQVVRFSDGTAWGVDELQTLATVGTDYENDILIGFSGSDQITGEAGDDILQGDSGDDVLDGGYGNDILQGGSGNDAYIIRFGDGMDTIIDAAGHDRVVFEDFNSTNTHTQRDGDDLVLTVDPQWFGAANVLTIKNWFFSATPGAQGVKQIEFSDGEIWSAADLMAKVLIGTSGQDTLIGYDTDDFIQGQAGSDVLNGGKGNDTYVFQSGDGADVISEADATIGNTDTLLFVDLLPSDIEVFFSGNDLLIKVKDSSDSVRITNWTQGNEYRIETLSFADGSSWDVTAINAAANPTTDSDDVLVGTEVNDTFDGAGGNDTIFGRGGNDVLMGGAGDDILVGDLNGEYWGNDGNDILIGGLGNDTLYGVRDSNEYHISRGEGFDTIYVVGHGGDNSSADDTLVLGPGITLENITVQYTQGGWDYPYPHSDASVKRPMSIAIGFGNGEGVLIQDDFSSYVWEIDPATEAVIGGHIVPDDSYINPTQNPERFGLKRIRFADGTTLQLEELIALADGGQIGLQANHDPDNTTLRGSVAKDEIRGNGASELIDARDGNDIVQAQEGDDVIAGGLGDDLLDGGDGFNTFAYNRGDGHDVVTSSGAPARITLGGGLLEGDIGAAWDDDGRLVLIIEGGQGSITIADAPEKYVISFISSNGVGVDFSLEALLTQFDNEISDSTIEVPFALFSLGESSGTSDNAGTAVHGYAAYGDLFAKPLVFSGHDDDGYIEGTRFDDTISVDSDSVVIETGDGADKINLLASGGEIYAGAGNDTITLSFSDGVIDAGEGDDTIALAWSDAEVSGGSGSDRYIFDHAAEMRITEVMDGSFNRVDLYGVRPDQMYIDIDRDNGFFKIQFEADYGHAQIIITGFDSQNPTADLGVNQFVFFDEDGNSTTTLSWKDILEFPTVVSGDAGSDRLVGLHGDDEIWADLGDDLIIGGRGNDLLYGGDGDDFYVYNHGDGLDTIIDTRLFQAGNEVTFGPGIDPASLQLELTASNQITIWVDKLAGEGIRLENVSQTNIDGDYPIERFRFANGMVLTWPDLTVGGVQVLGTANADDLSGTSVIDTIIGGTGDDQLAGGDGADVYRYNLGDGIDTIVDTNDTGENTIEFGAGVASADLALYLKDGRLFLAVGGSGDGIYLSSPQTDPFAQLPIAHLTFANGETMVFEELLQAGIRIEGSIYDDAITGTNYADFVSAGSGNDVIATGPGGDHVDGGSGDDTYLYNRGDGLLSITDHALIGEGNTLRFGAGITLDDMVRSLRFIPPGVNSTGEFIIRLGDSGDEVRIAGFNPSDPELGAHGVEAFEFADGTLVSFREMIRNTFVVQGDINDDVLSGTALSDRLYGYEGNDDLSGGDGADVLTGGVGDDILRGQTGNDIYIFDIGSGHDAIKDSTLQAYENLIVFGDGITRDSLSFESIQEGLRIHYGLGDSLLLEGFDLAAGEQVVATVEFSDGSQVDIRSLINQAPQVELDIADAVAEELQAFSYVIPTGVFTDSDAGDVLTLTAFGPDGNSLPEWLSFNSATRTLSGTPGTTAAGSYTVVIVAMDSWGKTAQQSFEVQVNDAGNRAPRVSLVLVDQSAQEDLQLNFAIPAGAFVDLDVNDALTLSATLADGSALPSWLNFDSSTGVFSGTPGNGNVGQLLITVTATDLVGANASQNFTLAIADTNDAPVANVDGFSILEDSARVFTQAELLANDTDPDSTNDPLTVIGVLNALNGSVVLNPDGTITFVPTANFNGTAGFDYVISDGRGGESVAHVQVDVDSENDAPVAVGTVGSQSATEDQAFTFSLPSSLFTDADGQTLGLSVTLSNGAALPTWLSFNSSTGVFSGTPANNDVGHLSVTVKATDPYGASATQTFSLNIENVNDAPVALGEAFTISEDVPLVVTSSNLLSNDTDQDNSQAELSIVSVGNSQHGTVMLLDNGSVEFIPDENYNGTASFSYNVSDGSGGTSSATVQIQINAVNDAPIIGTSLTNQAATTGNNFSYALPASAFSDPDSGDTLSYSAKLADGSALPSWLSFNTQTKTLSGTPTGAAQTYSIAISATDSAGLRASQVFSLAVSSGNQNSPPITTMDTGVTREDAVSVVNGNVLTNDRDPEGAQLRLATTGTVQGVYGTLTLYGDGRYRYTLNNSSSAVQGLAGDQTAIDHFVYRATDGTNVSLGLLAINVEGKNDKPELIRALADRHVRSNSSFSWQIPSGSFADVDRADTLTYSATQSNGKALPSWLKFNAQTMTFSGTAPRSVNDDISIKVTVSDGHGSSSTASDTFKLIVGNRSDDDDEGGGCARPDAPRSDQRNLQDSLVDGSYASGWSTADLSNATQGFLPSNLLQQLYGQFKQGQGSTANGSSGDSDASNFARWLAVDQSVAAFLSQLGNAPQALDWAKGVNTALLNQVANGFLGSTQGAGSSAISLAPSSGYQPVSFEGLGNGVRNIS